MNSNIKDAVSLLKSSGFEIQRIDENSAWGQIKNEPVSLGKDHFAPRYRSVYLSDAVGGYYVTSHIVGDFRKYRGRTWHIGYEVANIFGHGKTAVEAVNNFLSNFKQKRYNVGA